MNPADHDETGHAHGGITAMLRQDEVWIGKAEMFGSGGLAALGSEAAAAVAKLRDAGQTTMAVRKGGRDLGVIGLMDISDLTNTITSEGAGQSSTSVQRRRSCATSSKRGQRQLVRLVIAIAISPPFLYAGGKASTDRSDPADITSQFLAMRTRVI